MPKVPAKRKSVSSGASGDGDGTGDRDGDGSDRNRPTKKPSLSVPHARITLEEKVKIIDRYEKGESITAIARSLNKSASTINTIVKAKKKFQDAAKGSIPMGSTAICKQRMGPLTEMEKLLMTWVDDQTSKKVPLSLMLIQAKARSLYDDIKKRDKITQGTFVASHGWFNRFKKRANLHNISIQGESASADVQAADDFPQLLREIIEEHDYLPEQIFNVDETGLYWKKMPGRTYISALEKKMPGFKCAKDRITILLGGNATGDCKLKPMAVYHSLNPRAFKGVSVASLPVFWKANKKAWVTMNIFEDWFMNCFIPEVKEFARRRISLSILCFYWTMPLDSHTR